MGRRVKEEGASERRPVMGRIGVERRSDITPRESGQTSLWSFVTREPWPTDSGRQADMSAAATLAGAASHDCDGLAFHRLEKVYRTVRRLQARIVKAVREGRWGKVKALVYLLTHSFSGRALAILRVTTNSGQADSRGGRRHLEHPGQKKAAAFSALAARLPTATAAPRVHSQRATARCVLWAFPRMTDRAMQALYLLGLDPIAETTGGSATPTASAQDGPLCRCPGAMLTTCWQTHSADWILEGDIKRASIGSATTGCWPTSPWTRPSSRSG